MTTWPEMLKESYVPTDLREAVAEQCRQYSANGFGYTSKDYTGNETFQLQLLVNAFIDEDAILYLLNTNKKFVEDINSLLDINRDKICTGYIQGEYEFNTAHGLTDHNLLQIAKYDTEGPWVDILRAGNQTRDYAAIWSIEVKSTTSKSKQLPKNFHKADLVLVHVMDTDELKILAPTAVWHDRTDKDYICVGTLKGLAFNNVSIDTNWGIHQFKNYS